MAFGNDPYETAGGLAGGYLGAAAGTGLGGPLGTVAGGYLGAQLGMRAGDQVEGFMGQRGGLGQFLGVDPQTGGPFGLNAYNPSARQAAPFDPAMQAQLRDQQQQLIGQLQQQASGQGPSIAAMQAQSAGEAAAKQAQGLMAAQRGLNPALGAYMAGQQLADAGQQTARAAAEARLAEMQQARGLLGQTLAGARGQDLDVGQLQQQGAQWNAGAQNQMQSQQNQQISDTEQQRHGANYQARNQFLQQAGQAGQQVLGKLLQAGGQIAGGAGGGG